MYKDLFFLPLQRCLVAFLFFFFLDFRLCIMRRCVESRGEKRKTMTSLELWKQFRSDGRSRLYISWRSNLSEVLTMLPRHLFLARSQVPHTHKHTKPGLFSVTRVATALYASPMMYSGWKDESPVSLCSPYPFLFFSLSYFYLSSHHTSVSSRIKLVWTFFGEQEE